MHRDLYFFPKLGPICFLAPGHRCSVCPKGACHPSSSPNHQDPVQAGFVGLCSHPSSLVLFCPCLKIPNPFEQGALASNIIWPISTLAVG